MNFPTAEPRRVCMMLLATALVACGSATHQISTPPLATAPPAHTTPPAAARSWFIQGHRLLAASRWDDAREAFEAARSLDPNSPSVLRGLAACARGVGDVEGEQTYLNMAEQAEGNAE